MKLFIALSFLLGLAFCLPIEESKRLVKDTTEESVPTLETYLKNILNKPEVKQTRVFESELNPYSIDKLLKRSVRSAKKEKENSENKDESESNEKKETTGGGLAAAHMKYIPGASGKGNGMMGGAGGDYMSFIPGASGKGGAGAMGGDYSKFIPGGLGR